jgi:hypothetical protein
MYTETTADRDRPVLNCPKTHHLSFILFYNDTVTNAVRAKNKTTNLLTPWSRVLPEKLTVPQLLKKFPAFYATRRFITVYTRARHLSLS